MQHIVPVGDLARHRVEDTTCWCSVDVDWSLPEAVVHHHAADGRPENGNYARPVEERLQPPADLKLRDKAEDTTWRVIQWH